MLVAVDATEVREYSLEADKEDTKTIFLLGSLDHALANAIEDDATSFQLNAKGPDAPADVKVKSAARDFNTVRFGLRGWKSFLDKDGKDVKFDTFSINFRQVGNRSAVSDATMGRLKAEWIRELAKRIRGENSISPAEEKNSDGPSS